MNQIKSVELGVPVGPRWIEITALIGSHPSFRHAVHEGLDPDDLKQLIAASLLVRNHGKSPWNPARCSFGTYVWMVTRSVISNSRRKHRRRKVELLGISADFGLEMIPVSRSINDNY